MKRCFRARLAEDSIRHAARRRAYWLCSEPAPAFLEENLPYWRAVGKTCVQGTSLRPLTQALPLGVEKSLERAPGSALWVLLGDLGGGVWLGRWQLEDAVTDSRCPEESSAVPQLSLALLVAGGPGRVSALCRVPREPQLYHRDDSGGGLSVCPNAAFSVAGFADGRIVLVETKPSIAAAVSVGSIAGPGPGCGPASPSAFPSQNEESASLLTGSSDIAKNAGATTSAAITGIACSPKHVQSPFFVWCNAAGSWGIDLLDGSSPGGFRALERIHLPTDASAMSWTSEPLLSGIDIHPDGALVALAAATTHPLFWDTRTAACYGRQCHETGTSQSPVAHARMTRVRWHPNGWHLACATTGGVIMIWDIRRCDFGEYSHRSGSVPRSTVSPLYRIPAHSGAITGTEFGTIPRWEGIDPCRFPGAFLASAGFDGAIRIWDAHTYALIAEWTVAAGGQRLSLDAITSPLDREATTSSAWVLVAQAQRLLHLFEGNCLSAEKPPRDVSVFGASQRRQCDG
jgi:hypothetical protein